jgi:hypothetical protein
VSKTKYQMTDAAAKRITMALGSEPGDRLNLKRVEKEIRAEGFDTRFMCGIVIDMLRYWQSKVEDQTDLVFHSFLLMRTAEDFAREYYEQRQGITEMTDGMMRLGILPYPEDDA